MPTLTVVTALERAGGGDGRLQVAALDGAKRYAGACFGKRVAINKRADAAENGDEDDCDDRFAFHHDLTPSMRSITGFRCSRLQGFREMHGARHEVHWGVSNRRPELRRSQFFNR